MLDEVLIKQIEEFCRLNHIQDVDKVINRCLRDGFNILKYGLTPNDNKRIEMGLKNNLKEFYEESKESTEQADSATDTEPKPVERKKAGRKNAKKQSTEQKEDSKPEQEETKPVIKRRQIKIIKKDA